MAGFRASTTELRDLSVEQTLQPLDFFAVPPPVDLARLGWDSMLRFASEYPTFNRATINQFPINDSDAATKEYVDKTVSAAGGFVDAPIDGNVYGRKDAAWTNLTAGASALPFLPLIGGTVTGLTTFSATGTGLVVTNNATVGGKLTVGSLDGASLVAPGMPTSNAGLPTGALWNNGGFVCVV